MGFVPLSRTGTELLFEVFSQRYERGSILVANNLPFDECTEVFGKERLTGALLDRLTHHVHILELTGESYRLKQGPHVPVYRRTGQRLTRAIPSRLPSPDSISNSPCPANCHHAGGPPFRRPSGPLCSRPRHQSLAGKAGSESKL